MTPPVAVLTPVNTAATRTRPSGVVDAVLAGHSHRGRGNVQARSWADVQFVDEVFAAKAE